MQNKNKFPYYYRWGNNPKRATMKGRHCRIVARGKMNSMQIEFKDGQREIVSQQSIVKVKK